MPWGSGVFYTGVCTSTKSVQSDEGCNIFFLASGVDDPNYGFQNDFGFAIVSVDDLDSAENSKKSLEAVEFFIQVSVPLRNLHKVMKGATSFSRCWR